MVRACGEYVPRQLEARVLDYWVENDVMEKSFASRGERFSFLEGPPTANAPPALHHVEVRAFKDLVNRFHTMLGQEVPRKAGWDCHGLPVEVQVEKELELDSKREILDYGLDRFVEKCRESVFSHIREWDELTKRMAYWVDLEDPYVTMDNDYIESVWWSLKKLWDKGLMYEGHRVVPFCTRCGTPLSSHEVAQGYQSVEEETVIVAFRAKERDYSILAWTTTPWTLLSNLALAVNPKIDYCLIKYRGEQYVLAKDLAQKRFPEADIVKSFKGSELVGVEYIPLFNHFHGKLDKTAWVVVAADFVSVEEGTGVVHVAPAFGEDDYNVGLENDLPLVNPIGEDGKFTSEVPELEGVFAKDADEKIIKLLDEQGALIASYPYTHDYPYCWRCDTPLLYYAMKSWFIKVKDLVPDLLKHNKTIDWYPETVGTGRFGNWLENARDWGLSRNRFWGTPLPIWECGCGNRKIIGSRQELADNAVSQVDPDLDLHRPYVDEVRLRCECGSKMSRVEYVIDCWYDSGAAPFAQYHYPFENRDLFEENFPYSFISEATDQTRGWFYTLLVLGVALFDKPAYRSCVVGGLLLDDKGEKMSKSNKNIIDPWKLFEGVGADAVRLQMCATAPWNAKRFGVDAMNEHVIPVLRTLWNCYSFTVRYMLLDGFDPAKNRVDPSKYEIEDRWIISAADEMLEEVRKYLLIYEFHHAQDHLSRFIVEDLSRWYIKLIRDRLWLEDEGGQINSKKKAAYDTLTTVLDKTCIALAPMAPFIAEEINLNLFGECAKSIHLRRWPEESSKDTQLNLEMNICRKIFEAGSKARQDAKIKLRHPIAKVTLSGDENVSKAAQNLEPVILKQLNCKAVEYVESLEGVGYRVSPDYKVLGPKYQGKANLVAKLISENPAEAKRIVDEDRPSNISGYEVTPDMISEVRLNVPEEYRASDFSLEGVYGLVLVEVSRSQSLMNEALARDLIRNIQQLRKKRELGELDRIKVTVSGGKPLDDMLSEFGELVKSEVRADSLEAREGYESGDYFIYGGEKIYYSFKV